MGFRYHRLEAKPHHGAHVDQVAREPEAVADAQEAQHVGALGRDAQRLSLDVGHDAEQPCAAARVAYNHGAPSTSLERHLGWQTVRPGPSKNAILFVSSFAGGGALCSIELRVECLPFLP